MLTVTKDNVPGLLDNMWVRQSSNSLEKSSNKLVARKNYQVFGDTQVLKWSTITRFGTSLQNPDLEEAAIAYRASDGDDDDDRDDKASEQQNTKTQIPENLQDGLMIELMAPQFFTFFFSQSEEIEDFFVMQEREKLTYAIKQEIQRNPEGKRLSQRNAQFEVVYSTFDHYHLVAFKSQEIAGIVRDKLKDFKDNPKSPQKFIDEFQKFIDEFQVAVYPYAEESVYAEYLKSLEEKKKSKKSKKHKKDPDPETDISRDDSEDSSHASSASLRSSDDEHEEVRRWVPQEQKPGRAVVA